MPKQAPLKLIKRCRLYLRRGDWTSIPHVTRGIYALYQAGRGRSKKRVFKVVYIGVGGVSKNAKTGVGGRIRHHDKTYDEDDWTHYSFFEVHDNVSREEILELEGLFLRVFRHDRRVELANVQLGSRTLKSLSKNSSPAWAKTRD